MKTHQRSIGLNDEWLTPKWILAPLGTFDLDPCAPVMRPWPTADHHLTVDDDSLCLPWVGRVWLNPPFDRYERPLWMRKMAAHGNGIMLIPAATETKAFYKWVWDRADGVCFIRKRPHFCYVDGTEAKANCGTAICLVAYGKSNAQVLEDSGLGYFAKIETSRMLKEAA